MRRLRRRDHLFVRSVRLAHADVLLHRAAFQPGLLQDHAVIGAQGSAGDRPHVLPVHPHGAPRHVVKAHEEVDKGGLAAAGRTHDRHFLPGTDVQREVFDQPLFGGIGEIHLVERDFPFRPAQLRSPFVGGLLLFVEQFEDARGAGEGVLQFGDDPGDLVEGLGVLVGVGQKRSQHAHRERLPRSGRDVQRAD